MRINCQLHYLLLFVVCLASALQAQPLSEQFPSSSPTPSVRFEHVTIEDGLSDNRINGFLQDSEGYMWFGSQDGLNRFDGYQFTSFWHDARDSTSLSGNYIEVLFEDHEQTMWVGTWGSGLNRYDRKTETFEHLRHDPDDPASLADDFISAIVEDTNGTLWIGTENGLSRFEAATGSFTTYRHDPDDEGSLLHNIIRSLLVDREGVLWAGTGSQFSSPLDEGGLNRYDAATNSFIRYPGDAAGLVGHHVVAMFEDRAGTLWVGTASGGIHRMDKVAGTFEPVAPALRAQSYLTFMHEDRLGRFWVGTASGVNLVDRGTGSFTSFLPDPADPASLATGRVWRIYEDRSGTLWIGCGGSGCLEKVMTEPKPFRHYPFFSGGGFYDPMYELRNGTLLLAANQIDMFDKERGHLVTHPDLTGAVLSSGATIDAVITFCEDSSGLIWIGGDRLLLAYNPDTRQVKDYASALFQSYENVGIWSIREAPDGMIWFAAGTYGLLRFDPASGETGTFNRVETLPEPISIHINSDGTMWVGTFGRGLCLFDPGTNLTTQSLSGLAEVLQIHPVTDGTIWLATNAGLVHFDPASGVTRTFTRDDGLPNNSLVGLIEDDVGYLWMATRSGGISRFDPKEEVFLNFDGRDGLGDLSFFSAIKDRSGNLYFYGLNGISEYVGGQRVTNPTPPEVRITGLTAKDQPISLTAIQGMQRVRLGHDQNDLTIHFQGFHYDNPNRNQHRVRLDPLDASWIDPGMERQVRYTNLDPGAYTFRVRAANSDGVWSEQEAELSIIIMPPLWRTWWAYVLYGLIFVLCIFAVSRIQRRRLIRKERERTRERELAQAREIERAYTKLKATQAQLIQQEKLASLGQLTAGIAHEIKNPLNFVNNLAEVNEELAQELRQGLTNGDNLDEIIDSIEQNSHVIKQHGKRADGIIRTMMHHARGGSGEWESTDINKLVYEYIDLAFHGKRVQVPNFNVKIEQYLDKNTGAAEIIPQEIGRVLLNLLGNAMDAVQERFVKEDADYTPIVKIVTERRDNRVLIEISDNGVGIPNANLEKIFEPFFTTKQSGTGTGLGLSLSYDIITQGHGGTLTVESMEGKGATFSMLLPVSKLSN